MTTNDTELILKQKFDRYVYYLNQQLAISELRKGLRSSV